MTEYRQKTSSCAARITIKAEYFSDSEIKEHVKELLWNYRLVYLPTEGDVTEGDVKKHEDWPKWEQQSEQAWSALEAAFGHHAECSRLAFKDTSEGAEERITDMLLRWTEEIRWPEGARDGTWESSAETGAECRLKTERFMEDTLWPFTKIIRQVCLVRL